jgi:hypothetical protein
VRVSDHLAAARRRVASEQEKLLRTLVASGAAPPGFDLSRVKTQAAALRQKRKGAVAAAAPDLVAELDRTWDEVFDSYAQQHPLTSSQRLSDAATFRRWLRRRTK